MGSIIVDRGTEGNLVAYIPADGRKLVVVNPSLTPTLWSWGAANEKYGTSLSVMGMSGTSYGNGNYNMDRLVPYFTDLTTESGFKDVFVRDDDTGEVFSITPQGLPKQDGIYEVEFGVGYVTYSVKDSKGLKVTMTVTVPEDGSGIESMELWDVQIEGAKGRQLSIHSSVYLQLAQDNNPSNRHLTDIVYTNGVVRATNPLSYEIGAEAFHTVYSNDGVQKAEKSDLFDELSGMSKEPVAGVSLKVEPKDDKTQRLTFVLGKEKSQKEAARLLREAQAIAEKTSGFDDIIENVQKRVELLTGNVAIQTPNTSINMAMPLMAFQAFLNHLWMKGTQFQPGAAFGFRDQLQSVINLLQSNPSKENIKVFQKTVLTISEHMLPDGEVLHWLFDNSPDLSGEAVFGQRKGGADTKLWFMIALSTYYQVVGDLDFLSEKTRVLFDGRVTREVFEQWVKQDVDQVFQNVDQDAINALYDSLIEAGFLDSKGLPTELINGLVSKVMESSNGQQASVLNFLRQTKSVAEPEGKGEVMQFWLKNGNDLDTIYNKSKRMFEYIQKELIGPNGLPLTPDWNDSLSKLKGESLMTAFTYVKAMQDFIPLAKAMGDTEFAKTLEVYADTMQTKVMKFYDKDRGLFSRIITEEIHVGGKHDLERNQNGELVPRTYLNANTWPALAGAGDIKTRFAALTTVLGTLYDPQQNIIPVAWPTVSPETTWNPKGVGTITKSKLEKELEPENSKRLIEMLVQNGVMRPKEGSEGEEFELSIPDKKKLRQFLDQFQPEGLDFENVDPKLIQIMKDGIYELFLSAIDREGNTKQYPPNAGLRETGLYTHAVLFGVLGTINNARDLMQEYGAEIYKMKISEIAENPRYDLQISEKTLNLLKAKGLDLPMGDLVEKVLETVLPTKHAAMGLSQFEQVFGVTADIRYGMASEKRRSRKAGWTGYSASPSYLEFVQHLIMGFKIRNKTLFIEPLLPADWARGDLYFSQTIDGTRYHITYTGSQDSTLVKSVRIKVGKDAEWSPRHSLSGVKLQENLGDVFIEVELDNAAVQRADTGDAKSFDLRSLVRTDDKANTDTTSSSPVRHGGIDLNLEDVVGSRFDQKISIPLEVDWNQVPCAQYNGENQCMQYSIPGLVPVIYQIQPIQSLPILQL